MIKPLLLYSNPEERPTAEQLLSHPFVQPDPSFDFRVRLIIVLKREPQLTYSY